MIDYLIYHAKANGKIDPKVFKLTNRNLMAEETGLSGNLNESNERALERLGNGKRSEQDQTS